uniref:Arylsulphatase n=1 Tax=uncultured Acidobacteria bacterium A11 TaxID=1036854 RepID=F8TTJ2_9BACT|nr:arylsulphatase [uncultured Acidobacteria bacterium A11]
MITRRLLIFLALGTSLFAGESKPNILFILTDDQGWPTLGCYGNKLIATPHLDRLATEGARFTAAYAMPQCTPTRAALFTGQHTARTGMWHVLTNPWYGYPWAPMREPTWREGLPRDWFTLPKGLRAAGYVTGTAGKWHLTADADGDYRALKPEAGDAFGFDFVAPRGDSQSAGDKQVDFLTDAAIGFIREQREKPWFFYLAHHTVHGPVLAPEALIARHRARGAPEKGSGNATFLAALEHLDNSVGRLMAALDELGLRERTLVVFMSDNGGVSRSYDPKPFTEGPGTDTQLHLANAEFPNAPLRGWKGSPYEGGIRVPCLVRWPGVVAAGRVVEAPAHVVDWLPTLLEVAGAKPAASHHLDGVSLAPLLRGSGEPAERSLIFHMPLYDLRWGATPCAVVRRGDWKLIEHFGDRFDAEGKYVSGPHVELFQLRDDLGETRDLAAREPARRQALLDELHAYLGSCGAEIPGANPHHEPARAFKETNEKPAFLR